MQILSSVRMHGVKVSGVAEYGVMDSQWFFRVGSWPGFARLDPHLGEVWRDQRLCHLPNCHYVSGDQAQSIRIEDEELMNWDGQANDRGYIL